MNYSHPYINGELVMIVDSDDYLDDDAIETILLDWKKYKHDKTIGMFNYMRKTSKGMLISQPNANNELYYVDDDISYRVNHGIVGDRCEVVRTDVFIKYKMPVFEGERFMGEGWLWKKIALDYKTVYVNKAFYVTEYLDGGLSKSGRLFRMKNPYGMMENCKGFMAPQVNWKTRLKEILLFGTYGYCASLSLTKIVRGSNYKFLQALMLLPSYFLFKYWSKINGFSDDNI